ncbi:MAG: sterol desaturase family protein [Alphaproteobacteria bacterium]|nr:sterol desaturase family protein [Alphaproteobacteria bacterium]
MLDSWLQTYQDPMFLWFVVGANVVSMAAYLTFALPLTWLAWAEPAWAVSWRIQRKRPDVAKWFAPGLRAWAVNNAVLLGLIVVTWPLWGSHVTVHTGPWPPWWVAGLQLLAFVYLDDALYWVLHRAMHEGWLWRRVHTVHHRVVTPCAITGHYMHPVEYVATAMLMLVGPLVLGVHVVVLYAWIVLRQLEAAEGHCGYHLAASPLAWLPGGHGADFHDFHHARFHGNYAGILGWLDGVLGTWSKGYAEHRAARREG